MLSIIGFISIIPPAAAYRVPPPYCAASAASVSPAYNAPAAAGLLPHQFILFATPHALTLLLPYQLFAVPHPLLHHKLLFIYPQFMMLLRVRDHPTSLPGQYLEI